MELPHEKRKLRNIIGKEINVNVGETLHLINLSTQTGSVYLVPPRGLNKIVFLFTSVQEKTSSCKSSSSAYSTLSKRPAIDYGEEGEGG